MLDFPLPKAKPKYIGLVNYYGTEFTAISEDIETIFTELNEFCEDTLEFKEIEFYEIYDVKFKQVITTEYIKVADNV